jgi:MFS family permease
MRMIQGLCLGGEYGGAITYVAEHVPDESRGYYTGWLQTSPTLGIVVSLAVIIGCRTYFGNDAFNAWAWRVPFLVSFLLVAVAIWIRLQLGEKADLRGDQGQGADDQEPLEGGLPQLEYQIHPDRHRRADRARRGLV